MKLSYFKLVILFIISLFCLVCLFFVKTFLEYDLCTGVLTGLFLEFIVSIIAYVDERKKLLTQIKYMILASYYDFTNTFTFSLEDSNKKIIRVLNYILSYDLKFDTRQFILYLEDVHFIIMNKKKRKILHDIYDYHYNFCRDFDYLKSDIQKALDRDEFYPEQAYTYLMNFVSKYTYYYVSFDEMPGYTSKVYINCFRYITDSEYKLLENLFCNGLKKRLYTLRKYEKNIKGVDMRTLKKKYCFMCKNMLESECIEE